MGFKGTSIPRDPPDSLGVTKFRFGNRTSLVPRLSFPSHKRMVHVQRGKEYEWTLLREEGIHLLMEEQRKYSSLVTKPLKSHKFKVLETSLTESTES